MNNSVTEFILFGLTQDAGQQKAIFGVFLILYLATLLGNFLIVVTIKTSQTLESPMYFFLFYLAFADACFSTTTAPRLIVDALSQRKTISYNECMTQVFASHFFGCMEIFVLILMAFDRYVAICNPLRHSAILTHAVTWGMGLAVVLRGTALLSPHPFLLRWLPYCRTNVISHTYCEFMALIKIACAETRVLRAYSLAVAFLTGGVDFLLIICSYVLILHTVFHLPSKDARLKTLGTCGSHVCVILVSYTPAFFSFLTHRFGHHVAAHVHIFVANIYLLVPPMVNPVIYGVRTKKIRDRFLKFFSASKPLN